MIESPALVNHEQACQESGLSITGTEPQCAWLLTQGALFLLSKQAVMHITYIAQVPCIENAQHALVSEAGNVNSMKEESTVTRLHNMLIALIMENKLWT